MADASKIGAYQFDQLQGLSLAGMQETGEDITRAGVAGVASRKVGARPVVMECVAWRAVASVGNSKADKAALAALAQTLVTVYDDRGESMDNVLVDRITPMDSLPVSVGTGWQVADPVYIDRYRVTLRATDVPAAE